MKFRRFDSQLSIIISLIVLLLLFGLNQFFALLNESETFDEPAQVLSGYLHIRNNDFRISPEAPPLLGILIYPWLKPLAPRVPIIRSTADPYWYSYLGRYFYFSLNDARPMIIRSRIPIVLCGLILGWFIFSLARAMYTPAAGMIAVILFIFSQNLNAFSRIATGDMIGAVFMFIAVYGFYCLLARPNLQTAVFAGLTTGLALIAKHTALLLLPSYVVITFMMMVAAGRDSIPRARLAGLLCGAGVVALMVIGFSYNGSFNYHQYLESLTNLYPHKTQSFNYCAGRVSLDTFWYYYLAAFLIKTPTPLLIALMLALANRRYVLSNIKKHIFMLVPAGLLLAASCFDQANLGIRRILPVYPLLMVFAAGNLADLFHTGKGRIPVVLLLTWYAFSFYQVYPHNLAYGNELIGGPTRLPYYLSDSNVDWGQEMPRLSDWQRRHRIEHIYLSYMGNGEPRYWGINYTPLANGQIENPTPGYYAISAHSLTYFRALQMLYGYPTDWLSRYTPIDRIGYSLYIYKF